MCSKRVNLKLHINDNVKLSLKDYRALIYSIITDENSPKNSYQFVKNTKNTNSLLHPNNHIKKSNYEEERKSSLQKDKTEKRFKTQGVINDSTYNFVQSSYSTSNNLKTANSNKKYTILK